MRTDRLEQLYRHVIIEESKSKKHRKSLENPTHAFELLNPSCGDVIIVHTSIADGRIQEIAFDGMGCAISMASASMMCEILLDKDLKQAKEIVDAFNQMMTDDLTKQEEKILKDTIVLKGVKQFPNRIRCATLSWKAFWQSIEKGELSDE